MRTAFISGHINITEEEFKQHYIPRLRDAVINGNCFVVGDANGVDAMAQEWLKDQGVPKEDVLVFHMFDAPRNNNGDWKTAGGFQSDDERDTVMTLGSYYDIAWVREGKEKSGTQKNINRRKNLDRLGLQG